MSETEQTETDEQRLPEGFLSVRFDQLLMIIAMAMAFAVYILESSYGLYILGACELVCVVSSFVARRRARTFVRKHGEIEIKITYKPEETRPKKNVLFREVGSLIDDGIDRILDGKRQK